MLDGREDGSVLGTWLTEGAVLGATLGSLEGIVDGLADGSEEALGLALGMLDGTAVGLSLGMLDGTEDGGRLSEGHTQDVDPPEPPSSQAVSLRMRVLIFSAQVGQNFVSNPPVPPPRIIQAKSESFPGTPSPSTILPALSSTV
jgi:hypothetical protein